MVPSGVVGLVEKGVALIVTVGLLWALGGAETALCLGLAIGSLVASLVAWTRLENRFRTWEPARIRALLGLVRDSFSFGVSGAASQLSRADVAIVTGVAEGRRGGLFAAPSRLTPFLGVANGILGGRLPSGRASMEVGRNLARGVVGTVPDDAGYNGWYCCTVRASKARG